jgi:hypothetical protein
MKRKILLSFLVAASIASVNAQKKDKPTVAYAITGAQKGSTAWTEVRLVDVNTGEVIKSIYANADQPEILNARTGKAIVKKDLTNVTPTTVKTEVMKADAVKTVDGVKKQVFIFKYTDNDGHTIIQRGNDPSQLIERRAFIRYAPVQTDKPFATNSAACAYDEKHDRLYYTPMGINQLRYIDLKDETAKIYYFEDEAFGVVSGKWDVANQITRMVIASDGNGYALSNNGEHLMRFTTKKKAQITDLGSLTDDASNDKNSIRNQGGFGGDMIADDKGKLYLLTANRIVFKIDPETMVATYKGTISGLPKGFSTNGAVVDKGTNVIVSSANSTQGYFKFDMNTFQAEALSNNGNVFNASDLANSNLLSEKKKKDDDKKDVVTPEDVTQAQARKEKEELLNSLTKSNISVYPNPVQLGGSMKVSFADQPTGKYTMQFMDMSGKLISSRQVTVGNKMQVESYELPEAMAKGNYMLKVVGDDNKVISINKIIVQ